MNKPVILLIFDGWGIAPPGPGNAITQSHLAHFPGLYISYPHTQLAASGEAVGLPKGEDGNTETGHLNIGAGRIVYQDLPRINMAIADGSFFHNPALLGAFAHAASHNSAVHFMGLIGSGGVHSNIEHLYALLQCAKQQQFDRVFIHLFTDGRDSPPSSALTYLASLTSELDNVGIGTIASVTGRYYAMDRDHRWDRTEKAYRMLTEGIGATAVSAEVAIQQSYTAGKTDEFIEPTIIVKDGKPLALIQDTDAVVFFNFRIDRPRQLTKAFVLSDFEAGTTRDSFDPYAIKYYKKHIIQTEVIPTFKRTKIVHNLLFVTMTEYEKELPVVVVYPPQHVTMPFGQVIADAGKRQLRLSETEKERFVTYYFNGQREDPFYGEDRVIVPSPKVATYDLKPEMAAIELTDALISRIEARMYDFILVNFANADMVGHTGVIAATIKACETIDACLGRIVDVVLAHDGAIVITADHGNAEEMLDPATNGSDTEHSTYPVPFVVVAKEYQGMARQLQKGVLADVTPTILDLMGIAKPSNMTGRNLLS